MTVDEPGKAEASTVEMSTTPGAGATTATGSGATAGATASRGAADAPAGGPTKATRAGGHRAAGPEAGRGGSATGAAGGWASPESSRSRRLLTTALTALGIAIGAAVVLGLVVAFLTRGVGASKPDSQRGIPSLVIPAGNAPSTTAGGGAVPADWTQQTTSSGLVFKAPPGWTQRTDALVDYRIDPNGPEQVGVGLSSSGDPDSAITSYAQNNYNGQTAFASQPAVDATAARGERARQLTLTYTRQGTPVTVVLRGVPTSRGVVVIATRSASDNPQRAVQLADSTDASLQRP